MIVCLSRRGGTDPPLDQYDVDQLDEARKRASGPRGEPVPRPAAHPAERRDAGQRSHPGGAARPAIGTPSRPCAHRRSCSTTAAARILLTGDRDTFIASSRLIALVRSADCRAPCSPRAGDRLALEHLRWTGARRRRGFRDRESLASRRSTPRVASSRSSPSTPTIAAPPARSCSNATPAATPRGGSRLGSIELASRGARPRPRSPPRRAARRLRLPRPPAHRRAAGSRAPTRYVAWLAALFEQSPDAIDRAPVHTSPRSRTATSPSRTRSAPWSRAASSSPSSYSSGCTAAADSSERSCSSSTDLDVARARFEALRRRSA